MALKNSELFKKSTRTESQRKADECHVALKCYHLILKVSLGWYSLVGGANMPHPW